MIFQVVAKEYWWIVLKEDADFLVYVHDKGEEYFMHHEVWPTIPPIHRVRKDDFAVDYTFQKLTNQKGTLECKHEPYNYFGTYLPYLSKYAIIKLIISFTTMYR